jgi:superfamily II DNA/RNA helicase
LEKFRNDPACKLFLSTDAGGTGLNLQMADTVVNLELPWNPAVLEQRIARVHRMGQSRPVRVVNFVTRGSIEERVLRTLGAKQGLFTGLFAGDADEIPFEAARASGFLDSMRALVNEGAETRPPVAQRLESNQSSSTATSTPQYGASASPNLMWQGVAQLLEAACATLANPSELSRIAPEMREKLRQTASEIAQRLRANPVEE